MNILKIIFTYLLLTLNTSVVSAQSILINGAPSISNNNEIEHPIFCEFEPYFSVPNAFATGLASDGENFWIADNGGEKVYRFDLAGIQINSFDVPYSTLAGMTLIHDTLWLASEQEGLLIKMNKNTGEIYSTHEAPLVSSDIDDPNTYGLTDDGDHLWVCDYGGNAPSSIIKINPTGFIPIDTITVESESLLSIFYLEGSLFGVDLDTEALYQIDTETGDLTFIDNWCTNNPYDIAHIPCKGIYCSSSSGTVFDINQSDLPIYLCGEAEVEICEGESYQGNIYSESTMLIDTFYFPGIDSIFNTSIIVHPTFDTTLFSFQCKDPDTEPGTYFFIDNLSTFSGCDSLVTNILEVYPNKSTTFNISLMPGEEYNGMVYFSDTSIINLFDTQYGCDSIVTVNIIMEITSTEEGQSFSPNIYPNPSQSILNISELPNSFAQVVIYNNMGKAIYEKWNSDRHIEIQVDNWPKGIYFLTINDKNLIPIKTEKIIFQ